MNAISMNEALSAPMLNSSELPGVTVREYLKAQLRALWIERESFSGKRPLGNSGWEYEVIHALITCGYIQGSIDWEVGQVYDADYDQKKADKAILDLIDHIFD